MRLFLVFLTSIALIFSACSAPLMTSRPLEEGEASLGVQAGFSIKAKKNGGIDFGSFRLNAPLGMGFGSGWDVHFGLESIGAALFAAMGYGGRDLAKLGFLAALQTTAVTVRKAVYDEDYDNNKYMITAGRFAEYRSGGGKMPVENFVFLGLQGMTIEDDLEYSGMGSINYSFARNQGFIGVQSYFTFSQTPDGIDIERIYGEVDALLDFNLQPKLFGLGGGVNYLRD